MKDELFYHVHLKKGTTWQVAWIAARGAKVGNIVQLLDEDPEDQDGWEVMSVGDKPIRREEAVKNRDAWRTQREASDI